MLPTYAQEDFSSARILVVGDIIVDKFIYGEVERISPEAPVPVLRVSESKYMLGGAGNVAANIVGLGASAVLVGVVGGDNEGMQVCALLDAYGGGIKNHVVADIGRPTTLKTRYVSRTHHILRADFESTAPIDSVIEERLLGLVSNVIEQTDFVIVADYAKGVLTDRFLAGLMQIARTAGRRVMIDPKRRNFEAYRGAFLIKPNKFELSVASGLSCRSDEEIRRACEVISKQTGASVMVTRSEEGMTLLEPGGAPVHVQSMVRELFDVSGAGDTVAAALGCALASGRSIHDAMQIASAAASIAVSKSGTAIVTAEELASFLRNETHFVPATKLVDRDTAAHTSRVWAKAGLDVGFTNGCFDLLHPGHISLLRQAASACDRLIVGINSDASVRRLKGRGRPIQTEQARAEVLAALEMVDAVVIFDEDTPLELIGEVRPRVLVKGADYTVDQVVGADLVKADGGRVILAKLASGHSSTRLVNSIAASKVIAS